MDVKPYLATNKLSAGQTVIIGRDGNVRVASTIDETSPGEVFISNSQLDSENANINIGFADDNSNILDITSDIDDIIDALEAGDDPTELGDEFATASGSQIGSSPSTIGSVARTAEQTSPRTAFDTEGLIGELGLTRTQSLSLVDQFREFQQSPILTDSNQSPLAGNLFVVTDEDSAVSGQIFATDPNPQDALSFVISTSPTNGEVFINSVSGIWVYTPNTNYDGGDAFEITVDDGNGGTDTAIVNIEVTPIPEVSLTGPNQVNEGDSAIYVATFDKPSTQVTQINLSLSPNSAELGDLSSITVTTADGLILVVESDGTVNVPASVTSLNISVGTTDDDVFEGSEDFQLDITPGFGTVGGGQLTTTIQDDDTPELSVSSDSVVEGGAAVFDVELSNDVDGDVTYEFALSLDGQSAEWRDFASNPLSVSYQLDGVTHSAAANNDGSYTIAGNATDIQVSVQTQDDSIFEGSETFTLSANASATVGGDRFNLTDTGTGTITDDRDGANNADTPELSVSSDSVVEGGAAVFDVELSNDVDGDVTYEFALSLDGQSAEWRDFASNPLSVSYQLDGVTHSAAANNDGSYTIAGNATDIQVSVQTQDDSIFEGSETFTLSANASATVGGDRFNLTDTGTGTITDDRDGANNADTPELSVSSDSVVEGGAAVFDVELSNDVDGDVTYEFALSLDGQSAEWGDFASNPLSVSYQLDGVTYSAAANNDGSYTIAGNATDIQVSVQTQDDSIFEGSETFTLSANASATVGGDRFNLTDTGTGTITDDRDGANNADTPELSVSSDSVVEGGAAVFDVELSNDVDGDVTYEFALSLDGQSAEWRDFASNPLSVSYQLDGVTHSAAANNDGSYTIAGNATDIQVSVQTQDDSIFEGSETFTLSANASATVGGDRFNLTDTGTGTITDDRDGANNADTPELSVSSDSVVEGGAAVFDVELSNDVDGDVTYEFALSLDGQSAEWGDFASNPLSVSYQLDGVTYSAAANNDGSYTIAGNATDIQVSVQTQDDSIFEGSETFTLSANASATVGGDRFNLTDTGIGTITDDRDGANNADTPELSVSSDSVVEGGAAVFDVELSNDVDGDVTYEFALSLDGQSAEWSDFASNPLSVSYQLDGVTYSAAANNDGSYTIAGNATDIQVSVQTQDDSIFEGSETFTLSANASATVGGDRFNLTDTGTGTITDDRDGANNADTPELSVSSDSVVEGGAAVFDVELSNDVDGDVTYEFALSLDGQSAEWSDFASNPLSVSYQLDGVTYSAAANNDGSYTIAGNATDIQVSVQTQDDSIFEGSETFTLSANASATVGGDRFNLTDTGTGTITDDRDGANNADTPELSVSSDSVVEGGAAVFDVELSNDVDGDVTYEFALSLDGQSAEWSDFASNPLSVSYQLDGVTYSAAANNDGSYTIAGNATDIQVSVQTQDDSIFEGSETFTLSANASATVGGDRFNLTDTGTGTITDDSDRPQVSIVGGGDVAEGDTANFTVQLSNTATSAVSFVLALNAGDTSSQDLSAYQYQTADGTWQDVPDSGEIVVPAGSDSVNVKVVTEQDSVYEGDESFSLSVSAGNGTVLAPTSTSASATILDFADNPPQAEDFTVTLDPSGNAGIFFNSNDAAQDHISDSEDDSTHTPLGVVITELPQSGQLYYDNQLINTGDITTFSANGEVIHQGTVFADPNLIRYDNDTESTGFVLGVKQAPEGMDGATSQIDFLNWGESVQGNSAQRVMQFENGDTITITSSGQSLTQYFGDANHIGYGLGVGNDGGIQQGETITLDFSDRPSTSVEVGLDGLGGWFEEGHNKETAAVIQARLDDGSLIEVPVTKETSGNSNLFHIATIDAPEGRQIDALIVTTDGPGNWELRYLEASSNDTFEYRAVDSDNNYSDEHSVTLVESNDAPVATDDPVAFDVALGTFNSDSWSHDGVSVSASYQGQDKSITQSGVKRGVSGDENGGPGAQIQYNREEGESEQLKVSLDKPATEFSFAISNLYKDEGGSGNHEQGKWVAYLGDNPVASGTFVANESNNRGSYHFDEQDLGGIAFDSVVFEAIDFTHIPARGSDASDYFLTGFKASGEGAYAANQGDVVEIPLTALLGNDVDPNGDNIRITHLSEVNHADARIENGIVYIDLDDDFVGDTTFDYVITDDKGGYDEATVSIVVNPLPQEVAVNSISMFEDSVTEGEDLVYQVSLDEGVLQETRYSVTFGQPGSDSADNTDVDLSNVMFTHGVTYDAAAQQVVVPVGVNAFSVVISTVLDGTYEHTEAYTLTLGGQQATGTIENVDIPQVSVSEGGSISEGSAAEFTVSLSKNTSEAVTVNVSLAHLDTDSADISVMEAAYQNGESWQAISIAPNGDVILPAGVTQVRVTVQTMDDNAQPVYEGPERFELTVTGVDGAEGSASSISTIVDDGSVGSDDDRPQVSIVGGGDVAEGDTANFTVQLSNTATSAVSFVLALNAGDTSSQDLSAYQYQTTDGTWQDVPDSGEIIVPAGSDSVNVKVVTEQDSVYEGDESFSLSVSAGNGTVLAPTSTSASATILDFADNPPQAEDFTVTLDPSGNAGIFFNSNDAAQDHISDSEDDSTHTPLGVVITELPQSGQLYYDNQLINTGDLTTFSANGEVIHQGTVFADPNLIRYANDTESTGFVLGVKQAPEGMDGATSQSHFLNWGEPVQGNSAQRVMQFENGDTITITSSGQSLTQYFGDANHIGYGLGVGNDGGIQQGETITLDFSDRPSTSVEVGLDGLGGWFEEGHNKETAAVIQARLDDGSLIEVPVTKETSGNSNLFHIATIDAPEGRQIDALIVTTDGPGNWELRYLEASSNDTFEYRAVDSDNNYSDEHSVTLVESNDAPVATDDPVAFDVALGTFNSDSWSHDGVSVSASYQGQDKSITQSGVKRGVSGDENGGPGAQIQYNREEGESEQLKVSFDKPATEFSFAISNLYKNEGGSGNHEQGKWVAYLGDNPVASGTFVANESNNRGSYHFDEQDLGGVAFDSVVFEAIDFTHIPARGSDASDYFLTGFKASGEGAYAANQGDVVEIPLTALLGNDVDPNGDNIRITHLSEVNHADARIENGIVYIDLDDDFVGDTSFDYVITDDKGGYAEATVSMVVNPLPQEVAVNSISMFEDSVTEGEDLVYQVSLDEGVLQETRYSVTFGQLGSDSADNTDVDLSNVMFTHGVTYDAAAQQVVVPVGVNAFSVVIPTVLDGTYEHTEAYTLTLGGQQATGTIENVDIPQVSVSEGGSISEGSAAEFTVSLSKNTAKAVTVNVSLAHLDTDSADISVMEAAYQNGESWQAISIAPNGDVILPAGVTQVRVTVQTMDDNAQPVYEGPERFELTVTGVDGAEGSASSISTIVDDGSVGSDDDRPQVSIVGGGDVAEGDTANFTVQLSNTATSAVSFVLALNAGDTSSQDLSAYQYQTTDGTWQDVPDSGEIIVPAGSDSVNVKVVTEQDSVYEGDESFSLSVSAGNGTVLAPTSTSASATILDFADNPPQAEDFTVTLDPSGNAGIFFNSNDAAQDHISDSEDDSTHTPLGVVITELPQSGQLYYDNQLINTGDLTTFSANGEVIHQGTVFADPNLIRYANDTESTGFVLGVKQAPEGMDGATSQSHFLNWGEPVQGNSAQRVMQFENGDTITITSSGQSLTQYFGDANHIGYGLGVGNDGGIQQGETITLDFSDRPSTSVEVGLDGLGGWFEEGHNKETAAVIQARLDDGSLIEVPVTKETSGNSNLFHIATIDAPEGRQIDALIVTTDGPGNWELRYLEASSNDTFEYRAVDSDNNYSDEHSVTLVESNDAPVATDDPVAFDVALGTFNSDSWSHDGVSVSASYQGQDKSITQSGVKRGVSGDENGGPGAQIQYNREEGESEQLKVSLDKPATEFSFAISNLYKNEGGSGNHEQGKWVAYLGDNPVASGTFVANESNNRGSYHFDEQDLGGVAFDSVVFEAIDFTHIPARGSDASDYFLTGFKASGEGAYAANQGDVVEIPLTALLGNDVDPNGDNIRITHLSEVNHADARIENGIVYIDLDDDFVGDTSFDYVITDDKGGYAEATVSMVVNPLPQEVAVTAISMYEDSVTEGEDLVYQVSLDEGVLQETRYSVSFGQPGSDSADNTDVDLSNVMFTHGVTYDAAAQQVVVPVGVNAFSVVISTVLDGTYEHTEAYTLTLGGQQATGTIENVDIPQVSVSEGGSISEGSAAEFTVSLSKNTSEAVTVNVSLAHLDTDSADISVMEAAYQNGESWQAISIAPNGDVILPAGVTQVRVTVQTMDDNAQPVYEGPERFELTVTGVDGAEGSASSISTIVDDGSVGSDDDRPIIESVSDVTVAEGNDAIFNVTLSSESNTDTHVILELKERKASSPEDYDGSLVTVTYGDPQQVQTLPILNGLFEFDLPAGETDFSVAVKTVDDEVSENNETFLLVAKTEYQSNQVSAKATIEDNEKPVIDLDGSQYQIEFVSEDAGYRNVFGYYVYDPDSETQQLQILMSDSHDSRQSSFEPVLATLGSLDNVEYFLIADGAGLVDSVTPGASFEVDADGRLIINGNIQPNTKVLLSHDEASLMRTSVNDNGDTIINFDDQVDHAHDDNDYDDLVIKIAKQDTNIDYSTDFVEGDGAVSIVDTDADIFDDKDSTQSMHVLLNKVYEGDQLTWSTMSGFSVNQTNTATGLSLLITSNVSGGVSAAEFEAFLEGIKYENISENPDETVREIDVYVTDSYGQSSETATTTITVSKVADLIVEQNSVGIEDGDIALNVTVPQGSSVTGVVLNNLPQGVVLKSGNDLVPINNGEARLTSQQLSQLTITPPNDSDDNFIVNVNGYTSSNELIEEHTINVQVDAITDIPTITVSDAEVISQQDFDSIELGNSSWRGNVTSSELTQADGVEGIWGTDNSNNYNEVGKETVYRGGVLDKTNHIYELEGRNGDDQLFTQFNAEAGQFYTLSFDVAARRVNDSPMTVFLEDESGHREVLFEYTDQQSINWQTENINFQTLSDGDYKVVFESETSSNSYGALLDDIRLEKADNIGFENSYIPLSDILVSLSDSDGSETLSLILNGLPEDTIIRDGNGNSMTVVATVDGKNSTDLSAWSDDLTELEVYVSNDGVYPLEFIVSAQDNVPANTESVSKVVNLTVLPSFITYEFESGSHGNDVITGNDDHEVIVGDVQGIQIIAGQDYNIAFVLDTSGSMRNTVGQAKSEILEVFDQLHSTVNSGPNAGKVNILLTEFSTSTGVIISVDLNSPTAREDFVAQLSDIEDSGSGFTNYEASFDATIEWFDASTNSQAENITYFITDGNPNYIQRSKIGESQFDELVLDFDTSTKNLVTLEDILPPDYILGSSVTYKGQEIISDTGMVKSPLTGAGLGNITNSNGLRYSDSNSITIQTRHMYQLLALVSSIEAIGIGNGINAATLSQYDTDGAVVSNINVDQLAETVLGQEIALEQGEDQILGGHGDDILFGDLINFDNIDGQGVSALQKYVAAETRSPLVYVSAEEVSNFVRQHYTEFDVSRDGDQNDILSGGSGNDVLYGQGGNDILDGGSGNDILLGGEGDDILIGGLGSDILSGGAGHDQFVWRDNELDGGTDVITDFHVSEDKIDISDLLTAGETMDDLLPDISANAIDNNIELTIHRDSGQYQSIKLENVADQLSGLNINHGNIVGNDLTDLLNEIIVM